MPEPAVFGRRQKPLDDATASLASSARVPQQPLGAEAERFRAELTVVRASRSAFADWRRSRRGQQMLLWLLSAVFMAPGLICFVMQAPLGVSIGLEVAALVANSWIRYTRRRRLTEITAWADETEAV